MLYKILVVFTHNKIILWSAILADLPSYF